MNKIKIIIDSSSEYTPQQAKALGLELVPLTVTIDGKSYRDGYELTREELFKAIADGKTPVTSQPSPGDFRDVFVRWTSEGYDVLCLLISSGLSGTYQSACVAKTETGLENVYIPDSHAATVAIRAMVLHAIELVNRGKSAAEIAQTVIEQRDRARLVAIVPTLKYLVRGGRVSPVVGLVGNLLGIHPIMGMSNGIVASYSKPRGAQAAFEALIGVINDFKIDYSKPIVMGHACAHDAFVPFLADVTARLGITEYETTDMGATIGAHCGPGAMGIGFYSL